VTPSVDECSPQHGTAHAIGVRSRYRFVEHVADDDGSGERSAGFVDGHVSECVDAELERVW